MWENAIWGGGTCKNTMRLSIYDGPLDTVKYTWVIIWCMLYWIFGFCHKTSFAYNCKTPPAHNFVVPLLPPSQQGRGYLALLRTRTSPMVARCHNNHATNYYDIPIFESNLILLPQSRIDPGHIPLPSHCKRHFSLLHHVPGFSQIYLHDINHGKELIFSSPLFDCLIPTLAWHSPQLPLSPQKDCSLRLLPLPKVASTFPISVHPRPDLAHAHAAFVVIALGTHKLTHSPRR